jgi:prolipoprotein diacylglyceryltransferase
MELSLLWAATAGALALYAALRFMGRRDATVCVGDLWDIALAAAIAGLVVGRLAAMIRGGVNPLANPGDIILVRAGVDTVAASVAALLTAGWMARRHLADQLDALAPAALAGLAGWHAGCMFRGACLGTPSDLPWAWAQTGSEITRHPVELYAALSLLAVGIVLAGGRTRFPTPWALAGIALASAGLVRLLTEPLRPAIIGGPVWWYASAIAVGASVAGWAWFRQSSAGTGRL